MLRGSTAFCLWESMRNAKRACDAPYGALLFGEFVRQISEIVVAVGYAGGLDGGDADSRFCVFERHAYRTGSDHFEVAIAAFRIAMIVAGKNLVNAVVVEDLEIATARLARNVEVLVFFVGVGEKERD